MIATRNKISHFQGSWGSGLALLVFEDGSSVYSDNGPLGRALDNAFDAVGPGHAIDNSKINGKDVVYFTDGLGLMEGFTTYDEWLNAGQPDIDIGESIDLETGELL